MAHLHCLTPRIRGSGLYRRSRDSVDSCRLTSPMSGRAGGRSPLAKVRLDGPVGRHAGYARCTADERFARRGNQNAPNSAAMNTPTNKTIELMNFSFPSNEGTKSIAAGTKGE